MEETSSLMAISRKRERERKREKAWDEERTYIAEVCTGSSVLDWNTDVTIPCGTYVGKEVLVGICIHSWDHRESTGGVPQVDGVWETSLLPEIFLLASEEKNVTALYTFFLLGFQINGDVRILLFCLLLVVYCGTICGNLLIISLVSSSRNLRTPMYFFISHLSISDLLLSTDIVPNMLHIVLNNGGAITFIGCITQFYFFSSSENVECFVLAVMSYDRYVAICNPLRYTSIMTSGHCVISSIICWFVGFLITLFFAITLVNLNFCGPNIIDHVFCDIMPLLDLSCSDTFIVHLVVYVIGTPLLLIPTTIIVVSYTYIVSSVLRISSSTGRQKAFSTCSSHLIVVSIFYGTIISVYLIPTKGRTLSISKILSLLYTVFTPLVNPIIYSLRNKDIRKAVQETLQKPVIWWIKD
ncbi:olfactory receptor 1468-like [Hyla sarda]|uniref:olfactory receptor 1468-like n=1 Tax=Hyla sarda TaxID=327740 RepID=UPI0024C42D60|nr:olfactory receptor 1468-like [Hyla sarda]